ncbi:MAG: hypothetical protein AAFQ19_06000 [Pseudomonadota bacterium]
MGDVPVDSAQLADDLAALRAKGAPLRKRMRSKLIIPDAQIKYLTIDTGAVDDDARRAAARLALDGATPYTVDALAFDISPDGDQTHVAAVALETLAEAEAFAVEHKFNPVSFVAAPEGTGFLGEPFFGQTEASQSLLAQGAKVEPDGVRVVVVSAPEPEPEAAPDGSEDAPEPATTPVEDTAPEPQDDPEDIDADDLHEEEVDEETEDDDTPLDPPIAAKEIELEPGPEPDDGTTPPLMGFATRRKQKQAAPLGGVTRNPPPPRTAPTVAPPAADLPPVPPISTPKTAAASLMRPVPGVSAADPSVPPVAETPPAPRKSGFLSRRKAPPATPAKPNVAARKAATADASVDLEAERMTVFGARGDATVGGKPRFLGLILTAILLVFLAGVAAWASVFLDDGLAKLFPGRERTLASTLPDDTRDALAEDVGATTLNPPDEAAADEEVIVAALNDSLTDGLTAEDAAVLDALRDPLPDPVAPEELDAAALEARYAVTGIWPKAPQVPAAPDVIALEDLYVTGIDPVSPALDAVALPAAASFSTDLQLAVVTSPAAPGTSFARDADGFYIATPEGALTPEGYTVFAGRPPLVPPAEFVRLEVAPEPPIATVALVRPQPRPADLVEQNERATLGGLSRTELAALRPRLRPAAPQEVAEPPATDTVAETEVEPPEEEVSPLAAAASLRPETRPRNFDRIVARATPRETTRTAAVAPRTVTPAIPTATSVAREATVRNAINLSRVNLIGVYGTPSDRRALVRLSNGRYRKVQVGDRFDGGRVSAIGDSELRYQKGNRNVVLKMPKG